MADDVKCVFRMVIRRRHGKHISSDRKLERQKQIHSSSSTKSAGNR